MPSSDNKIRLNRRQLDFLVEMTEIQDTKEAVKKFAAILTEERVHPSQMAQVIDFIIKRMKEK